MIDGLDIELFAKQKSEKHWHAFILTTSVCYEQGRLAPLQRQPGLQSPHATMVRPLQAIYRARDLRRVPRIHEERL